MLQNVLVTAIPHIAGKCCLGFLMFVCTVNVRKRNVPFVRFKKLDRFSYNNFYKKQSSLVEPNEWNDYIYSQRLNMELVLISDSRA